MKKVIVSIMIILMSVLCMVNYSYAAEQLQATINIEPDKVEVSAGDKVTFTFTTKNIANAEYGKIYAIEGVIEFDENFFAYDSGLEIGETGKFNSTTPVSEGGTNGSITLKVIDEPTGSGVVKFTELAAGDGRLEDSETLGVATTADQEITITLKQETGDGEGDGTEEPNPDEGEGEQTPNPDEGEGEQTPNPDEGEGEQTPNPDEGEGEQTPNPDEGDGQQTPNPDEGNGNQEPTPDQGNNNQNTNNEKDNTIADKEIPKAGISSMIIISMVIMGILAVAMYKKNKKYQDIR